MNHVPLDPAKVKRQKRLEETLRENLRKRKEQARGRADPPASNEDSPAVQGDEPEQR